MSRRSRAISPSFGAAKLNPSLFVANLVLAFLALLRSNRNGEAKSTGPNTGFEIFVRGVRTDSLDESSSRLRERQSLCAIASPFPFVTAASEHLHVWPPRCSPDAYIQIVGERNVRIVPDVAVIGANASSDLLDGLLGLLVRNQTAVKCSLAGGRDR